MLAQWLLSFTDFYLAFKSVMYLHNYLYPIASMSSYYGVWFLWVLISRPLEILLVSSDDQPLPIRPAFCFNDLISKCCDRLVYKSAVWSVLSSTLFDTFVHRASLAIFFLKMDFLVTIPIPDCYIFLNAIWLCFLAEFFCLGAGSFSTIHRRES